MCAAPASMEKIMTKPTHNAEVTEISLEELELVDGGVTLTHEETHARVKPTFCAIVDNPGTDLFMMCWRDAF
jgi:hypothetical protein